MLNCHLELGNIMGPKLIITIPFQWHLEGVLLLQTVKGGIQYLPARRIGTICAASVGRDRRQLSFDDDLPQDPYFLSLVKEAVWGLRSLFIFLVEQPSQLKYIEWPGFRSTLKTATLTLVLVALLIVALSSTDSALSYLLALILRRTP
ncbi:hypothetical protein PRUPE_8G169100 [Prunus persica]|uniref:Uncharacterized protein n=1 Tax=Prunus persica TaxID=3760 RepID=A0A251MZ29_PRUPE|nr:hypothetical protein PRUPE_8G169100 [Prunus persica]ONH92335.1 hypothetical protein PRUPE_8G169100 [Prunus persica]